MLFMPESHAVQGPPYGLLITGVIFLCVGVASNLTGQTLGRSRIVYKYEEPREFWQTVAVLYICGVFLVGDFLYRIHYF